MCKKLFILDFDGTIVDTRSTIIETINETLASINSGLLDNEKIRNLIGLPIRDTFIAAGIEESMINVAIDIYRSKYNANSYKFVKLFSYVKETLDKLARQKMVLAIASNKGKESIKLLLKHLNIDSYFSFIGGEEDAKNKKPAPDIIYKILNELEFEPQKTIMTGDTIHDVKMGKAADCITCAVSYGYGNIDDLKKFEPHFIISSFKDLLKVATPIGVRKK